MKLRVHLQAGISGGQLAHNLLSLNEGKLPVTSYNDLIKLYRVLTTTDKV
jgi:hypothetical protein